MLKVSIIIVGLLFAVVARADEQASGMCAYRLGSPILMELNYESVTGGWSGHLKAGKRDGKPSLTIYNDCFFLVTRGRGEFQDLKPSSKVRYRPTNVHKAKHGELVATIGDRVEEWMTTPVLIGAFSTTLDLSELYKIDKVGIYTVFWGIGNLWEQEIEFSVVPAGARADTVVDQLSP